VDINKQMKRTDRDEAVLDSAIQRFEEQLTNESDIAKKVQIHRDLTGCYLLKKEYAIAEQKLIEEIRRQSEMEQKSGRIWAERALSDVYVAWSGSVGSNDPDAEKKRLELMKKAYQLNPRNSAVMRQLTRMGVSDDPEVAREATSIYNGLTDPDAPASVLNEIGSQALSRSDHVAALRYFEMARQKAPKNPEILNNLAYTYIVSEDPNPKRGLTLITEALGRLPNTIESRRYLTFFRDTRGQALMQLNKWTEAAADFEFALIDRPNNKKILEALIQCYRANGLDPTPYVERLRAANENDSEDNPDQGVQTSGQ
jgi:tetratricopeptide (TPR) repeat protein